MGSFGDDDFSDLATNTAKDYIFNGGQGDDLIIGAKEPATKMNAWDGGDVAQYDASSKFFDVSVKELALTQSGGTVSAANGDWNNDGTSNDSKDQALAQKLYDRFGTEKFQQVIVTDLRPKEAADNYGTDILYGIERIEFKSGTHGYEPFELAASKHMDQNGYIGHYEGTGFSDVFNGDAGNTFVKAGAGNDVIIAGNGADIVEPGSGVDYINGGLNAKAGGGSTDSWFRDEALFQTAPRGRVEVEKLKFKLITIRALH